MEVLELVLGGHVYWLHLFLLTRHISDLPKDYEIKTFR
jgi:hypothetical protein